MKEFDLEKAKAGHPVCTKNGFPARIICFNRISVEYPIVVLIKDDEYESVECYTTNGQYSAEETSEYDLVMEPTTKEGWVNIYCTREGHRFTGDIIFNTKEEAIKNQCVQTSTYVDTAKIKWDD